ncbi:MAG: hypothetical protein Q4D84_07490 [Campylobacter sp.]|nr:hypothetical protein [Campylobacter sp.]
MFARLIFLSLLLSACAAKFELPNLAKFDEEVFEIATKEGLNTLYVARVDDGYNFTLISALGAPLARRILTHEGKFKNIGFLPPNSSYNELFIKTLEMISLKEDEREFLINQEKFKVRSIDIR